jgi:hypothetical protein
LYLDPDRLDPFADKVDPEDFQGFLLSEDIGSYSHITVRFRNGMGQVPGLLKGFGLKGRTS